MTTPKEQQMLKKHDADISKLLKVADVLIRRMVALEKENYRLKHDLTRAKNSISTIEHRLN